MLDIYKGVDALPEFQRQKLLDQLNNVEPSIVSISAEYIHFVETTAKLSPDEKKVLQALLTYDTPYQNDSSGQLFLVAPRPGTISPWSSKATDIAHNSGLEKVAKVERGIAYYVLSKEKLDRQKVAAMLHDRMLQTVFTSVDEASSLFKHEKPATYNEVDILQKGRIELIRANAAQGLALSEDEIDYLYKSYKNIGRNPTDVELMMFGAVNSEHCRHKIFNAEWIIDGEKQPKSLFKMIKNTYEKTPENVLSAYSDNAAVLKGHLSNQFLPDPKTGKYSYRHEPSHLVIKAETHNHPTAIAPFPGAATGVGGEIRDEGATGRGGRSKMGFSGFSVSNLNLPDSELPWEKPYGKPDRIASPLEIMIEGPLGGSAFANEFGRPNLAGYFRTYEQEVDGEVRGYHKPLMLAGGLGCIREKYVDKKKIPAGTKLIALGGPSMLIGLGGGSASSVQSGQAEADLDFASVQRGSAEMQRRAQEVISTCWSSDDNPILSIHDVGAGGLSNAFPELVNDNGLGAEFELRDVPNAEPGMSPMEIWCNESQERYVLAVHAKDLERFRAICERERCPYAIVGTATKNRQLIVSDKHFANNPVDIPMDLLFGNPPKMTRVISKKQPIRQAQGKQAKGKRQFDFSKIKLEEAVDRVLHLPAVASKKFLITIGDRTVGGLTIRDQMVGPWQVPVADVAVTATSFQGKTGEAMAIGERAPIALIDAPASVRMAVGESITNIAAAPIGKISDIKLSANWMAAAGHGNEDQKLYESVRALGEDFCPELGVCIPVGKDSLSMRSSWQDKSEHKSVTSPLSLIISAFSPVKETSLVLTPQLMPIESCLILIDLGLGKNRLGGSALAQAYGQIGNGCPDVDPEILKHFFAAIQQLNAEKKLLAYHDRSDGGLFATLAEMSFASRCGLDIELDFPGNLIEQLFSEELGAVLQVKKADEKVVLDKLKSTLGDHVYAIGKPTDTQQIIIKNSKQEVYKNSRAQLEAWWAETSYKIQKLRDNPELADQEYGLIQDNKDPGLSPKLTFKLKESGRTKKARVAVFREQGINGQVEMAAAFGLAGFEAVDVHLSDLQTGRQSLDEFSVLAVCGGFSYGDVLGAGEGWSKSILFNESLRRQFKRFFEREDTLSLGICNGCQMLAALKELIPGASNWPKFLHNASGRFEARLTSVQINDTPSVFFQGMAGSVLPIPVAHGEGRAVFESSSLRRKALQENLVPLQYVDNYGHTSELYPSNPNGSADGITALTSLDGRATILMPHPERVFLTKQLSWRPDDWTEEASPWLKIFQNARTWVEQNKNL